MITPREQGDVILNICGVLRTWLGKSRFRSPFPPGGNEFICQVLGDTQGTAWALEGGQRKSFSSTSSSHVQGLLRARFSTLLEMSSSIWLLTSVSQLSCTRGLLLLSTEDRTCISHLALAVRCHIATQEGFRSWNMAINRTMALLRLIEVVTSICGRPPQPAPYQGPETGLSTPLHSTWPTSIP